MWLQPDDLIILMPETHIIREAGRTHLVTRKYEITLETEFLIQDIKKLTMNIGLPYKYLISIFVRQGYNQDEARDTIEKLLKLKIIQKLLPYSYSLDFHEKTSFKYMPDGIIQSEVKKIKKRGVSLLPPLELTLNLGEAMKNRKSLRNFQDSFLKEQHLSTLLWSMYGFTEIGRTLPSAGGVYPLNIYLMLLKEISGFDQGIYEYLPEEHSLRIVTTRKLKIESLLYTHHIEYKNASVFVVICGDINSIGSRYLDRGYRYLLIEAGLSAQNAELAATSLNISSILLGGINEEEISEAFQLESNTLVLLGMVIG
ncbi:SagB/ThcOx family dehydrogenase [Bacillus gobiensis]|uniref:SagB/ThcOx family dehydrogenase n=1 Tax=Bacillus gobiensis TaxID=1441095 RepID=UPI003D1C605A